MYIYKDISLEKVRKAFTSWISCSFQTEVSLFNRPDLDAPSMSDEEFQELEAQFSKKTGGMFVGKDKSAPLSLLKAKSRVSFLSYNEHSSWTQYLNKNSAQYSRFFLWKAQHMSLCSHEIEFKDQSSWPFDFVNETIIKLLLCLVYTSFKELTAHSLEIHTWLKFQWFSVFLFSQVL